VEPNPLGRKRPVFGALSVVLALLTFLVPILIVVSQPLDPVRQPAGQEHDWEPVVRALTNAAVALLSALAAALLGLIAGLIAVLRPERFRWLAVTGLVANGVVVAFFALVALRAWAG
jgi:ABC-type Fe3+ transport system permease subunit